MPSGYAHYKFAAEVFKEYGAKAAECVRKNEALYMIGAHGPDLFFYYKALTKNPVNSFGFAMHEKPAAQFFAEAKSVYLRAEDKDAALSYLLGFLCHFSLDHACHSYIEKKIAVSGLSHARIETEFDRFLLEEEGKEPLSARLTDHIRPSRAAADVIAKFFPMFTGKQIEKSMRSMIFYNGLLRAPHLPKRIAICAAMRFAGKYESLHGMMIARKPVAACADSNLRLKKLFAKAKTACLALTGEYLAYLDGAGPLPAAFKDTFGPAPDWQSVPVLSAEEEKNYEI